MDRFVALAPGAAVNVGRPGAVPADPVACEAVIKPELPLQRLSGEAGLRALVGRVSKLIVLELAYAGLRALHPQVLDVSRDKLSWFL